MIKELDELKREHEIVVHSLIEDRSTLTPDGDTEAYEAAHKALSTAIRDHLEIIKASEEIENKRKETKSTIESKNFEAIEKKARLGMDGLDLCVNVGKIIFSVGMLVAVCRFQETGHYFGSDNIERGLTNMIMKKIQI